MTIKGSSEPVVALLDEFEGSVMVRHRGGVTGKRSVKNLRQDATQPAHESATPVTEDPFGLSAVQALCPVCREASETVRSAVSDSNLRVLRVRLICPKGHEWEVEMPQTPEVS